ncbi:MAG: hypothetical protein EF806_01605 [Candidatus Methanoliparum thermophilum]|uniref:Uncharacterized protein n=1 Tax=Methanoliparum thermophilum TaxID=2491083 RepID=A0A520KTG9_METT2|nr:MAG: hypothetical protein EF806_01605 [Candidatus Methanoliparum thermophilum]
MSFKKIKKFIKNEDAFICMPMVTNFCMPMCWMAWGWMLETLGGICFGCCGKCFQLCCGM